MLNRNEPIRKSDVRWRGGGVESMEYAPISYIGLTWESVVNDVHSEATTVFIRRVAQYSIPPVPEFPGWVHIGLDAPLQAGDVAIVVRPDVFIGQGDVPTRLMSPLDGGGSILHTWHGCIGKTLRETYPQDPNIISGAWSVYRQIGVDAAPQVGQRNPRIISNPPEPLPLP